MSTERVPGRAIIGNDELRRYKAIEAAAKRAAVLVRLLTVRQVINAGDEAINAAGLNPWCINEGLAEGDEPIGASFLDFALAPVDGEKGGENG